MVRYAPTKPFSKPPSVSTLGGSDSPALSIKSIALDDVLTPRNDSPLPPPPSTINLQVFVPELQIQKCLSVNFDEIIWDIKQKLFESISKPFSQSFNFGLFLPPCEGRAGKFLLEDRPIRDYPFHDCVPYVELKYKKRVYKMLKIDETSLKNIHSKSNLKKFIDCIRSRNFEKVEKMCNQGIDPNFHDPQGETPLTTAAGVPNNRDVLVQLIGGGAHLDFRNAEGQTSIHKAAFLSITENVRTLLELGASPNYRDLIGLTPLYYAMLTTDSVPEVAEMLLADGADLCVLDMHLNTALHQACKNGLSKHVEQLLYYGCDINAQNINGNTPLHVCAVNGRVDCAQVLLYRGANPAVLNKQGQTAVHLAQVVGNLVVSDSILAHNPHNVVLFRGTPKFSTRRRQTPTNTSQIFRRRSLSHLSICSSSSTPQNSMIPLQTTEPLAINTDSQWSSNYGPSTLCSSSSQMMDSADNDYGTLRKIHPESVQSAPGFEPNIPRILVIPKGPKGFGFILRGAKSIENDSQDDLLKNVPALQFFEGVDMSGMAMRAGLRPGDYLLEINGIDVRRASHEQVVKLICKAGDIVTLKVITIDSNSHFSHYAPGNFVSNTGTLRRNHSIPRNSAVIHRGAPMPPQRHPSTGLSLGRSSISVGTSNYSHTGDYGVAAFNSVAQNSPECRADIPDNSSSFNLITSIPVSSSSVSSPFDDGLLSINTNTAPQQFIENEPIRCASVKSHSSLTRRISAVELENLMVRQSTSQQSSQFQPISPAKPTSSTSNNDSKKFLSTAEHKISNDKPLNTKQSYFCMKRRSQQRSNSVVNPIEQQDEPLKSLEIQNSSTNPYSQRQRSILRPKTPPPPPPLSKPSLTMKASTSSISKVIDKAVPPAPPPPPPNLLKQPFLKMTETQTVEKVEPKNSSKSDGLGIAPDVLQSVQLKPVTQPKLPAISSDAVKGNDDFNSDLRNALAKRRSKVNSTHEQQNTQITNTANKTEPVIAETKPTTTVVKQYNGLSLRESVQENVQSPGKNNVPKHPNYSLSGGICFAKKDSGYTSSRTSLEPSECGDEIHGHTHIQHLIGSSKVTGSTSGSNVQNMDLLNKSRGVTLISQQLEDASIAPTTIACSISPTPRPLIFENPIRTPAVDYDDFPDSSNADSGNGDSDGIDSNSTKSAETTAPILSAEFQLKPLLDWTRNDVCSWLHHLNLIEYVEPFATITGAYLSDFNRAKFTKMGVTKIAHRQIMEQSLKALSPT